MAELHTIHDHTDETQSLGQSLLREILRSRRVRRVTALLGCVVLVTTSLRLMHPGVTWEAEVFCRTAEHVHSEECFETVLACGKEEHAHTEDCFEERLVCGMEEHAHSDACFDESGALICGKDEHTHDETCLGTACICGLEEHAHEDACYEERAVCGCEAHIHSLACFSDPEADTDDTYWVGKVPESRDDWRVDLLRTAASQEGYSESEKNYEVAPDGMTKKGYTIYGARFGVPYGDWCAAFVSWCIAESGVDMPTEVSCGRFIAALQKAGLYRTGAAELPDPGDLVFFDGDGDGTCDHVGLVREADWDENGMLTRLATIEGNCADAVCEQDYEDEALLKIVGFGRIPERDPETGLAVGREKWNGRSGAQGGGDNEKKEVETRPLIPAFTYEGGAGGVHVTVEADADAFPGEVTMMVRKIRAERVEDAVAEALSDDGRSEASAIEAVDISFYDDEDDLVEPKTPVRVTLRSERSAEASEAPLVVHIDRRGDAEVMDCDEEATLMADDGTVTFETDAFSIYALVYTVDFHFNLNGKQFDCTIPGGGVVSLSELAAALGIAEDDPATAKDETWDFVQAVESVTFSDPSLIWVGKVEKTATAFDLMEANRLYPIVSADIELQELLGIYTQELRGGDWALFSLEPFAGDETLTVTMTDGQSFTIEVTDAQRAYAKAESVYLSSAALAAEATPLTLPEAKASKTLTPNLTDPEDPDSFDGTYTLTLSMEVPNISAVSRDRANIVVIYDSSNSMHYDVPGNEWIRDDEHGTYACYEGTYYQLSSFGTDVRKVFSYIDKDGVTHTLGSDQKNSGIFCGPKYRPSRTRMDVAEERVKALAEDLLGQNTVSDPKAIELAFVEFASDVQQVQQPTTDLTAFNGWVDDCHTAIELTQNAGDLRGGTNWDAALRAASGKPWEGHSDVVQFADDDPLYIIFVSDGNPTARTTPDGLKDGDDPTNSNAEYDDGTRIGAGGLYGDPIPGVYGTGNSDEKGYNFARAADQASRILDEGTTLYNVGIFGDATRMQNLPNSGYFDGTDEAGITEAFDNIISLVTSRMGYTSLKMTDGLTSMTGCTVDGNPDDFTYTVTKLDEHGNTVDVTQEALGTDFPKATWHEGATPNESGYLTWDLGAKQLLLPGGTYSLSFVVWPSQEAYDLVADLNNGVRTYESLTETERSQVEGKTAPFSLKTNTRAEVTYETASEIKHGDKPAEIKIGEPRTAPLTPPDPMPLTDSTVSVQKVWNDSLDPKQLEDFLKEYKQKENKTYTARLSLLKDNDPYLKNLSIPPTDPLSRVWPEVDSSGHEVEHHISTGLMVSTAAVAESGLNVAGYPTCTDGTTVWYILEPGHDYTFTEANSDYHFELEEKIFHPMVVDGALKNVTFEEDGNVSAIDDLTTLTATNSLKGGIRVYKQLFDRDGHDITADGCTQTFTVTVTMQNPDGTPYAIAAEEGGWRLNYGPNNPDKGEPVYDDFGALVNYGRSERTGISGGTFTATLYAGDFIQVANVDRGVTYEVSEGANPTGFELIGIDYHDHPEKTVSSNESHQVYVKNRQLVQSYDVTILKTGPDAATPLPGAVFDLYGANYVTAEDTVDPAAEPLKSALASGADGRIPLGKLAEGVYYLVETEAPAGYIPLTTPVKITVHAGGVSYDQGGSSLSQSGLGVSGSAAEGFTLTVVNSTGVTLPSAGGVGTGGFSAFGAFFAGAALLLRQRKARRRE